MAAPTDDAMRERVSELTTELVEYPTTADRPEAIEACMDRIAAFFEETGVAVERYHDDGVPSLVASLADSKAPELMFHGHLDVVPAAERLFTPRRDANRLYGRGTADMKGGLAAMMYVLRDIAEEKRERSIAMMVVADEENGGVHGAEYLLEEEGYRPEFCITGEPNNLEGYMDVINKQKGVIQVELSTTGQTAHAATPEQGENAIERLMAAYADIKSVFEAEDTEWSTTVNFGRIQGGVALNQVPSSAAVELDIRYPNAIARDDVLFELNRLDGVNVRSLGHGNSVDTDPSNLHAQALLEHANRIIDGEVKFTRKPHTSDLRHFARHDIPGVAFGPEAYGSHEAFEYLLLDSLVDYQQILYAFATGGPYV